MRIRLAAALVMIVPPCFVHAQGLPTAAPPSTTQQVPDRSGINPPPDIGAPRPARPNLSAEFIQKCDEYFAKYNKVDDQCPPRTR